MIKPFQISKLIHYSIILLLLFIISCNNKNTHSKINSKLINQSLKNNYKVDFKNWHFKDIELDTIPGISLNRAYDSLLIGEKRNNVIVAVIDTEIDVNHENFKNLIWKNFNEIPNNNIDDDGNGYIDDINGWNFLGNSKGEKNEFVSYEYTRILREFNPIFQDKNISEIDSKDSLDFIIYTRAKKKYDLRNNEAKEDLDYINMVSKSKSDAENELSKYFLSENYTINDLDSLKKLYPKNKVLQEKILIKSNFIKYKFTDSYIIDYKFKAEERVKMQNWSFAQKDIAETIDLNGTMGNLP